MELTAEEKAISDNAVQHAKSIKRQFAKTFTDKSVYLPEENPVSVFMAGSPGAGKTEVSKWLLSEISDNGNAILRIDPDELRGEFTDYKGKNSYLFQPAISLLVEKIHDMALKNKQSFILDGTLSNQTKAETNIKRSLDKGRFVQILYIYQEPLQAWKFVEARELLEGRKITIETFIDQYFAARQVVNSLKDKYGKDISVDLLIKDIDGTNKAYRAGVDKIDNHIPEKYTAADIQTMLDSYISQH